MHLILRFLKFDISCEFRLKDRRTVQKFDCASQEKQERQKISECQSICNMWKASDFFIQKTNLSINGIKHYLIEYQLN
jgi:hypothetical protein